MIDMLRELNCVQTVLAMSPIAIVEVFEALPDIRRRAGQRHQQALCLALFTLAVSAGNRGFLAIGDWFRAYQEDSRRAI